MLKSNDYKMLFKDMLKDFHNQQYFDFTVTENFIPPEAVPDESRQNFLKQQPIPDDQAIYGYTITVSHAGDIMLFQFACINLRKEFVEKGIAEGRHPIAMLPGEALNKLWHRLLIDLMCSGLIRNRDCYYEERAREQEAEDRIGKLDVQPEKKGRIRNIHSSGSNHN